MSKALVVTEWYVNVTPERKDPIFYCDGVGNSDVVKVGIYVDGEPEFAIIVSCDGDMKARHNETGEFYTTARDFITNGYNTDGKVFDEDEFDWDMNPWFDLYTLAGDHLDCVSHDIFEAVSWAEEIVSDEFKANYVDLD